MTSLRGRHHPDDFYEERKNHSGRGRASRAELSKGHSRDHQRRIKPLIPELNEVRGHIGQILKKKEGRFYNCHTFFHSLNIYLK